MFRRSNTLFATGAALSMGILTSCGPVSEAGPSAPRLTPCEQLGINTNSDHAPVPVNPNIDATHGITEDIGDYVIRIAVNSVGDNSVTGNIIQFVEVENQDVCRRFVERGIIDPLQIHSNYEVEGFWSSERRQVAMIVDHDQPKSWPDSQAMLAGLVMRRPGIELTIVGDKRKSYTGSDNDGDAEYEHRDVAYQITLPLQ